MLEYRYECYVDGGLPFDFICSRVLPREVAAYAAEEMRNELGYDGSWTHMLEIETDDGVFVGKFKATCDAESRFEVADA